MAFIVRYVVVGANGTWVGRVESSTSLASCSTVAIAEGTDASAKEVAAGAISRGGKTLANVIIVNKEAGVATAFGSSFENALVGIPEAIGSAVMTGEGILVPVGAVS